MMNSNNAKFEFQLQPWEYDPTTTAASETTDLSTIAIWKGHERRFWLRAVAPQWLFFRAEGQDENWNWVMDCENYSWWVFGGLEDFNNPEKLVSTFENLLQRGHFGRFVIWPFQQGYARAFLQRNFYELTVTSSHYEPQPFFLDEHSIACAELYSQFYLGNSPVAGEDFDTQPASYWRDLVTQLKKNPRSELSFVLRFITQSESENVWDFMEVAQGSPEEMRQVVKWMLILNEERCNTNIPVFCEAQGSEEREYPSLQSEWLYSEYTEPASHFDLNYTNEKGRNARWQKFAELLMGHYQPKVNSGCFAATQRFEQEYVGDGNCTEWYAIFDFDLPASQPTEHERTEAIVNLQQWMQGKVSEEEIAPLLLGAQ